MIFFTITKFPNLVMALLNEFFGDNCIIFYRQSNLDKVKELLTKKIKHFSKSMFGTRWKER